MIPRHSIDIGRASERFTEAIETLPMFFDSVQKEASNLSLLMSTAIDIVSCGMAIAADDAVIWRAVKVAAQAGAAAFAGLSDANAVPFPLRLGDRAIAIHGAADESALHPSRWIQSFFLSGLCRDPDLLDVLATTPVQRLRQSSTREPEFRYLFVEALQAFWRQAPECTDLSLSALEATDLQVVGGAASDWTLNLDVPLIACLIYVHTCDNDFGLEFRKAVDSHKQYWNRTNDRRLDYRSYVSIELSGLAAFAFERGLDLSVESEYVPRGLVVGDGLDLSNV